MNFKVKFLTWLAGLLLTAGIVRADPLETADYGSLILGVYASGGTGSGITLSVNLGEFTKFATMDGAIFTVAELSRADLDVFGTGANFARSTVNWGVIGTVGNAGTYISIGTGAKTPKNTVFATSSGPLNFGASDTNALDSVNPTVGGLYAAIASAAPTTNSSSATIGSSTNNDSWYALQTLNPPLDFGYFTSGVTSTTNVSTLDLYELVPSNAAAGSFTEVGIVRGLNKLGTFTLSSSGVLTYTAATAVVAKTPQTITFAPLANKSFGDAPFSLNATASSGLSPVYSLVSGPATLSGSALTITGVGTVTVRASQDGNSTYAAATPVERSFTVSQATQTISFAAIADKILGDPSFALDATASSGLLPSFALISGPASLSDGTVTITGAGTVTIRATQAGNANYAAAPPVERSFVVAQAAQTISFAALADKTFGDPAFNLTATASSGLTPSFGLISGSATLSGSTLTITGAGPITIRATQSGNADYAAAAAVERSFNVGKASQSLSFAALPDRVFGDPAFVLGATASSGLTPSYSIVSGPATLSGSTLTVTGSGIVTVRAVQAGNINYNPAIAVERSFSVSSASQSITFAPLPDKVFGDAAFDLSASATSGLPPAFSIVSGPASLSGSTLTITGTGTVTVRASQAGDSNYAAASPVERSFNVAQATQTLSFAPLADKVLGDPAFNLVATASSGLTPDFTLVSGPATLSGSSLLVTGAGTVTVRASQAGNANYAAAASVDRSFNVAATGSTPQTITFAPLPGKTFGDPAFALIASSSSGLTPVFSIVSGPAEILGSTLTITGAGNVVVRAEQGGDNTYAAAAAVDRTFVVSPASQSITFAGPAGKTFGDAPFALSASASSGLAPSFSLVSGPATLSGSTLTLTGAGTVLVRATQAGDANYAAATPVERSFAVAKAAQSITFPALTGKTLGDAPFNLSASASSGLAPSFNVVSGPATLSGSTLTLTGTGTVVISASQAGNTDYEAAPPVERSFTVAPAAKLPQTITFAPLADRAYGSPAFALSATASSGLSPVFNLVSGPAILTGSSLTLTGTGTVTIRASQPGDSTYDPAVAVERTFQVTKSSQTITFAALPDKAFGDAPFALSASASSGLSPSFSVVSGPAVLSGSTLTLTGAGTVIIRASQVGDSLYAAAEPVDRSFNVGKTAQTITFAALAGKTYGDAPFSLSATASSGLAVSFSVVSGPAVLSGSSLSITGAGTVTIRASQAGNTDYAAASAVDRAFDVAVPSPRAVSNQSMPAGSAVSLSFKPASAPADLTYEAVGLPSGLTLDAASGLVTGTITASPATFSVTVRARYGSIQGPAYVFDWVVTSFPAPLKGKFEGLFVSTGSVALPVGKLEINVSETGAFTGRLTHGGPGVEALSGQLTLDSSASFATLTAVNSGGYTVQALSVSPTGLGALLIRGSTSLGRITDGVKLAVFNSSTPAPWSGNYTAAFTVGANFDPAVIDRVSPLGAGYATGTIATDGTLTLRGKLADGTAITGSYAADANATYRIFAQPHGTPGNYFAGWIKLTRWSTTPVDRYRVSASDGQDFYWNKPALANDLNYRAGFGPLAMRVQMATWLPPAPGQNLAALLGLSTTNAARLTLKTSGGSLSSSQSKALTATTALTPANTLVVASSAQAKLWTALSVDTSSGLISGSIKVQDTSKLSRSANWQGVILQYPVAEQSRVVAQGFYLLAPVARPSTSALSCPVTLTTP